MKFSKVSQSRRWLVGASFIALLLVICADRSFCQCQPPAEARDVLWTKISACLSNSTAKPPLPCIFVGTEDGKDSGFGILAARGGVSGSNYLLIPTRRLAGIEEPWLATDVAPNYWLEAWTAGEKYVDEAYQASHGTPLQRSGLALAVNSGCVRTQDQLHIHISCTAKVSLMC